jgi:hypothetical protein
VISATLPSSLPIETPFPGIASGNRDRFRRRGPIVDS